MRARALPAKMHAANEVLAFLLELAMLAGLAFWGASLHASLLTRVLVAVASPVAAGVVWGLFAAPRSHFHLPAAGVLAVKAGVFVVTAVAVYSAGLRVLAIVVGVIAFLNAGLAAVDRDAGGGGGRTHPGTSAADVVDDRDHVGEGGAEHPEPGQRDQPVR